MSFNVSIFIVFLPAIAAIILAFFPKDTDDNVFRYGTLAATLAVLAAAIFFFFMPGSLQFDIGDPNLQNVEMVPWIASKAFTIDYFMAMDGISFPLVVLTAGVSVLAMIASWSIKKQVKGIASCSYFWKRECLASLWRSTSSCSTFSGKSCFCRCTS